MTLSTKDRLLEAGLGMLLERGYNHLGIQDVLATTGIPKGSFYHHFASKEDFGLQVIDRYMVAVHAGLDVCLGDETVAPLQRVRNFFEATREKYRSEGYLGCLLGGLGQELSGINEVFRQRVEGCFQEIARRIAGCIEQAIAGGELSPETNAKQLADLLVDCWEGAALRARLVRDPAPLQTMLEFYFQTMATASLPSTKAKVRSSSSGATPRRRTTRASARASSRKFPGRTPPSAPSRRS
jgi:TetR/AcrR family transcriptional regulator, transcriptional repressor for nem operon